MSGKAPKPSLLDQLIAQQKPTNWYDRISPEVKAELEAVRAAYLAGELRVSKRDIHQAVVARFGKVCGITAFKDYLRA